MKRRDFVRFGTFAAATPLAVGLVSAAQPEKALPARPESNILLTQPGQLGWLDTDSPAMNTGHTWGLPWPRGTLKTSEKLVFVNEMGQRNPLQTWITATWPDGSVKWTGHAVDANTSPGKIFRVIKGNPPKPKKSVTVKKVAGQLVVDTGVIRCLINTNGDVIISTVLRDKEIIAQNARFIGQRQSHAEVVTDEPLTVNSFSSNIHAAEIEQDGPVRAVIKLSGKHKDESNREWLPFSLRLYFYAGGDSIRMSHSFIFDGDEHQDFIRALGLRFEIPQRDETYNRHVRFVGDGSGLWAESPHGITGLRRDPGKAVRDAQVAGMVTPPIASWDTRVSDRMEFVPVWNDFTLSQLTANGFGIKKRTKAGHAWIDADQGHRAAGVAYVGGASGGVLFGMRDFWQLHPAQIDIRGAGNDIAEATLWMWSPDAPAMDLRFYHDGLGMDTYAKQLEGLEIIYEDYEPGFGAPQGIARTTDITLYALDKTPGRHQCIDLANTIRTPAQIVAAPPTYLNAGVFGGLWSLPNRDNKAKADIENRLEWSLQYYADQVDQRHWYGFWNYGDVMHAYDADRHVWRYDIGGYAWDNSELSPDLWLWYSFLRSGSVTAFRLAEAMTRHNRDVDIYHSGRFSGLGTRHNVQHWGCSAKQLRISTAAYRRFHYFLTADERTGDVLWEVAEADRQLKNLHPGRKINPDAAEEEATRISVGTDWGSAAANWLTAWERSGDEKYRKWLLNAMDVIGSSPFGFFTGGYYFDIETKALTLISRKNTSDPIAVSALSAVFGLIEISTELDQLFNVPHFKQALLDYGRLYNAPAAERNAAFGVELRGHNLITSYSRLTAYTAHHTKDAHLAERAWQEFSKSQPASLDTRHIVGPYVLNPIDEAAWVSTNDTSQWGLAAIQNLALVGHALK